MSLGLCFLTIRTWGMRREACQVPGAASGMWAALSSGAALSGGKTREPRAAAQKSHPPACTTPSATCVGDRVLWAPFALPPGCNLQSRQVYKQLLRPKHLSEDKTPQPSGEEWLSKGSARGLPGAAHTPGSFPPSQGRSHTHVEWDKWDRRTVPEGLEHRLKSDTGSHCRVKRDSGPLCGAATPAGGPQLSLASASAPSRRSLRIHLKVFHRWEQT